MTSQIRLCGAVSAKLIRMPAAELRVQVREIAANLSFYADQPDRQGIDP
jgi:hypothetical protein